MAAFSTDVDQPEPLKRHEEGGVQIEETLEAGGPNLVVMALTAC